MRAVTPALCVTSFVYARSAADASGTRVDPLGNRTSFTYTTIGGALRDGGSVVPAASGTNHDADGRLQPAGDDDHRPARGPVVGHAGQPWRAR